MRSSSAIAASDVERDAAGLEALRQKAARAHEHREKRLERRRHQEQLRKERRAEHLKKRAAEDKTKTEAIEKAVEQQKKKAR